MSGLARYLPLAATLLIAPLTFAWGANMNAALGSSATRGEDARQGTVIARAPDGLFYVDVKVNGAPVHFLVDTGANVMMLTGADARRVGLTRADLRYGAKVATAGGGASMAWTRLDTVELGGRHLSDVRAGVVHRGLQVSLLGQNMLSRFATVTISGDRMRME